MAASYILGLVFSLFVFIMIFLRLRNSGMKERYAIWWVIIAFVVLLFSIFPRLLEWLSNLVGVQVPLNLGIFLGGIVVMMICLQFSVDLSKAREDRRRLTEEVAIQRARSDAMENRIADLEGRGSN